MLHDPRHRTPALGPASACPATNAPHGVPCVSGDAQAYAIERGLEDVAALVDAVRTTTGPPADLLGHSHGAICAVDAASDRVAADGPTWSPDLGG